MALFSSVCSFAKDDRNLPFALAFASPSFRIFAESRGSGLRYGPVTAPICEVMLCKRENLCDIDIPSRLAELLKDELAYFCGSAEDRVPRPKFHEVHLYNEIECPPPALLWWLARCPLTDAADLSVVAYTADEYTRPCTSQQSESSEKSEALVFTDCDTSCRVDVRQQLPLTQRTQCALFHWKDGQEGAIQHIEELSKAPHLRILGFWRIKSGLQSEKAFSGCPRVETLVLHRCRDLRSLSAVLAVQSLRCLVLENCRNIVDWSALCASGLKIEYLKLSECNGLTRLSLQNLTRLRVLSVNSCTKLLEVCVEGCEGLQSVTMKDCKAIATFSGLANRRQLRVLELCECESLTAFTVTGTASMVTLRVETCRRLRSIEGLQGHNGLRDVALHGTSALRCGWVTKKERTNSLLAEFEGSPWRSTVRGLELARCGDVNVLNTEGIPSLRTLTIEDFSKLSQIKGLATHSLTHFTVALCPSIVSLDVSQLTTLESLHVSNMEKMNDIKGVEGLPALHSLHVQVCGKLRVLRLHGCSSSLLDCKISSCRALTTLSGLAACRCLKSFCLTECMNLTDVDVNLTAAGLVAVVAACPRLPSTRCGA